LDNEIRIEAAEDLSKRLSFLFIRFSLVLFLALLKNLVLILRPGF
jgi:hypothetical protein